MDQEYQLATPENVPISYELTGVGPRFAAALLDSLNYAPFWRNASPAAFPPRLGADFAVGTPEDFLTRAGSELERPGR